MTTTWTRYSGHNGTEARVNGEHLWVSRMWRYVSARYVYTAYRWDAAANGGLGDWLEVGESDSLAAARAAAVKAVTA